MLILDLVRLRPSFILLLLIALQSFISQPINVDAQSANFLKHRGEGLWGGIKNTVDPIHHSIKRKYNNLSNNGRFIAGGCVGYGVSRVIIRTTTKTVKTIGCCYIAFEALEYCGLLKEARRTAYKNNQQLITQTRDYILRTVDGIRYDMRTQCNPTTVSRRVKIFMKKDKSGTMGFGTGAFLGFAL